MSDLINRADAIEVVEQAIFNHDSAIMRITAIPSAEAVHIETYRELYEKYVELKHASAEAVQGEWEKTTDGNGWNEWYVLKCPLCDATIEDKQNRKWEYNYCPNCGARMKGGDEE